MSSDISFSDLLDFEASNDENCPTIEYETLNTPNICDEDRLDWPTPVMFDPSWPDQISQPKLCQAIISDSPVEKRVLNKIRKTAVKKIFKRSTKQFKDRQTAMKKFFNRKTALKKIFKRSTKQFKDRQTAMKKFFKVNRVQQIFNLQNLQKRFRLKNYKIPKVKNVDPFLTFGRNDVVILNADPRDYKYIFNLSAKEYLMLMDYYRGICY